MNNLLKRILFAVLAIPILLWIIFYSKFAFGILVIIANIFAINELLNIFNLKFKSLLFSSICLFSTIFLVNIYNTQYVYAIFALFILTLVIFISSVFIKELKIGDLSKYIFAFTYISVPLSSFLILLNFSSPNNTNFEYNTWLIFSIFASSWICDSLAYFGGKSFGRRKLAKDISPNKTIEGTISGFIGLLIIALPLSILIFDDIKVGIILSISGGIFGQIGDLFESKIKREFNVKDSSNLIPGHGGILDRIDSLLFSAPITVLLIKFIV
ncbi:phosphatidate cytidylyltransferase [Candidatus Kapabacteria bacterium]|nr:phosphatidate cytidylyltransferase [Candidatus Kapabacteria bacterium]